MSAFPFSNERRRLISIQRVERYDKDIPFLCFLATFYVYTRYLLMIIQRKEHIPLPRAMFRLDFTMECVEPVLDFQHEDIAARELTERIASPAQYIVVYR